jgi:hypothetical protein
VCQNEAEDIWEGRSAGFDIVGGWERVVVREGKLNGG